MLKFLRKNTKTIVWTVVIAFVMWGGYAVQSQFQESNRAPGKIFGKEVSFRDYLTAGQIVGLFYVPPKDEEPPSAEQVEAQTWQFLILSREAKRRKITVSDDEVRQAIVHLLGNQGTLGLSGEEYARWVRSQFHREPAEFENQVRENLRVRKLLEDARKGLAKNTDDEMKLWLSELVRQARPEIYRSHS